MIRKILLALLLALVVIQFFRPAKNTAEGVSEKDIRHVYAVPADVQDVLTEKCYDCHSNNTRYPWYFNVQPIAWWLAGHVDEGKEELNFSSFADYPKKKADHKLEEVVEMVNDGSMPLPSYTWIHRQAKVTAEEANAINGWIQSLGIVKADEPVR